MNEYSFSTRVAAARQVRAGLLAGLGFAAVELLAALARPTPLDTAPGLLEAAGCLLGTAGLVGGAAALLARPAGRRAASVAAGLWALVWGPRAAREAGWPSWVGAAPAAVIAAAPVGAAVGLSAVGGALLPALRTRPGPAPVGEAGPDRPDILLITVDTARADAGLTAGMTPDAGWRAFDLAVAAAPWTLPSMLSLMTGLANTAAVDVPRLSSKRT